MKTWLSTWKSISDVRVVANLGLTRVAGDLA